MPLLVSSALRGARQLIRRQQRATSLRSNAPHVVVVGGGFGGLNVAKTLADAPVRVTVVDRRNYHLFSRCSTRSLRPRSHRPTSHRRFAGWYAGIGT